MTLQEIQQMPENVQQIIAKHSVDWEDTYTNCLALEKDLQCVKWTCEWGLDGVIIDISAEEGTVGGKEGE